jgi:hypothetical protein
MTATALATGLAENGIPTGLPYADYIYYTDNSSIASDIERISPTTSSYHATTAKGSGSGTTDSSLYVGQHIGWQNSQRLSVHRRWPIVTRGGHYNDAIATDTSSIFSDWDGGSTWSPKVVINVTLLR